tara:strand:- start:2229 stop:5219 length:2991 start_codon:yes stop_codon:yes gene_type:complete
LLRLDEMINKKINNALIFLSFFLPFILYFKTMAPTVSLWDCGEFIATSIIMGIPHPPGTPLYLIIGNFFSQIPILSDLGARVNLISPITSALSIMFLYMIIVYLIEKISKTESASAYYAAFIGALTFAVTDSQWFNAVEAEVYALSTLFTAIVVWLILKWDRETQYANQLKYLILIFYCMGLAIGIHLLNLLAIPFIALIIYFKYLEQTDTKITIYNLATLGLSTGLCFVIIYKGIIKGLPSIIDKTQNPIILTAFFIVIIITTIISNIKLKSQFNSIKHGAISAFAFMVMFVTLNELIITDYADDIKNQKMGLEYELMQFEGEVYNKIVSANNIEAREHWLKQYEEVNQQVKLEINVLDSTMKNINQNGLTYISLLSKQSGQSIFILVIMLLALIILLSYFYKNDGNENYYKFSQLVINCLFMVLLGYSTYALIFIRAQQNPQINYNNPHDIKSAYEYINRDQYGQWNILDRKTSMLINSQQNHESWKRYTHTKNPAEVTTEEVVRFVWDYQFNEMYFRYFAWQFIGKENWAEKTWTRYSVDQKPLVTMPPLQGVDWIRYGLPFAFLIGLYGLYYHFKRDPYRAFSVLTLFILTGIAIVVYLNQSDPQPRERDYAFVGSFFSFSIWIGMGIYPIIQFFKTLNIKNYMSALLIFAILPLNMGINDYYEHDRSQRYEAWDYAYNLLNSCEENGILFTNGDNDTFPLWYLQYVEKVRLDVKVVNLSLLNFPSYIKQLDQHEPSLNLFTINDEYLEAIESENMTQLTNLAQRKWFNENYPNMKVETPNGTKFNWEFKNGTYGLGLTNITIMNIIEKCFDNRPIYFSVTTGNNQLGLDDYLLQEGLVYKLTNQINMSARPTNMNVNRTLDLIANTYQFRNLDKEGIFYGPHIERIAAVYRNIFHETANHMVVSINSENNIQTSFAIRQLLNETIPNTIVPEMEEMAAYRTWEYYDSIIRYCMFMKEYKNGVDKKDMVFIEQNMPDLYEYLSTQFPELIMN